MWKFSLIYKETVTSIPNHHFFSTPSTFPTNCTNSGGVNIPRQPTRRRRNRRSHRGASVHLLHPPAATGRVLELVDASVRQYDCERKLAAYFRSLRRPAPAQGELADCLWRSTGQNRRRDWAQSGVRWRTAGKRFGTGKMSYGGRAAMSIDLDSVMRVFCGFFSVCLFVCDSKRYCWRSRWCSPETCNRYRFLINESCLPVWPPSLAMAFPRTERTVGSLMD